MDNFLALVKKRGSVRSYTSREIEKSKLDYILECARFAPSAVNFQPWQFIVVQSEVQKQNLQKCYPRKWFTEAPLYLIVCADFSKSWKRQSDHKDHGDIDAAIAIEHICLAAAEQELGTCWVCNFDVDLCKDLFQLPTHLHPVALIPLGYPRETEHTLSSRKEINEIVTII